MASEIKRRFTDAEMQIAKETDLPELLTHLGYQVRRIGRYHTTAEMDSLRIKDRRKWFRYSQNILMLHQEAPAYEQNFSMVMRVLEYAEVREDDDDYISPLDLLFKAMEHEHPESVALRQYKVFKQAAGDICSK